MFLTFQRPVLMVLTGGIVGSLLLLLVVYAVIQFRYKRLHKAFKPGKWYDLALWISILAIVAIGISGIVKAIQEYSASIPG